MLFCIALVLGSAIDAQAATVRSCSFVNGAVYGTVSVTYYPTNPVNKRRIVRLYARKYLQQSVVGPDHYWRLRYVGLRGTRREWSPAQIPTAYWDYNIRRSWTFYFAMRAWPTPFDVLYNCTVTL
jgi:hypothetical protein